eukprot:scaffold7846_cov153-Pinguiococcus_pyrenoidosus.AAC.1
MPRLRKGPERVTELRACGRGGRSAPLCNAPAAVPNKQDSTAERLWDGAGGRRRGAGIERSLADRRARRC